MLIRPITFIDLDGESKTENFHFNLTTSEVAEMELEIDGGLSEHLFDVIEKHDARELLRIYKLLISLAYGERTADGKYFLKENAEGYKLGRLFVQHPAYDALFMELMGSESSDEAFSEFLTGCLPKTIVDKLPNQEDYPKLLEEHRQGKLAQPGSNTAKVKKPEEYTRDELLGMTKEEFDKVVGTDPQKMSPEILGVAYQRKASS